MKRPSAAIIGAVLLLVAIELSMLYLSPTQRQKRAETESGEPSTGSEPDTWEPSEGDYGRLSWQIASQDAKLRQIEERIAILEAKLETLSNGRAQPLEPEKPSQRDSTRGRSSLTNTEIGAWMRASLRNEFSQATTQAVTAQLAQSLHLVPGAQLDDAECGTRFCRATFKRGDQESDLVKLFGTPPMDTEGFTALDPEGRVSLYFTRAGTPLEDIRRAVQAGQEPE